MIEKNIEELRELDLCDTLRNSALEKYDQEIIKLYNEYFPTIIQMIRLESEIDTTIINELSALPIYFHNIEKISGTQCNNSDFRYYIGFE